MEYPYKGGLMEEDMFKFKVGGRTSEQTFTNAMTLLKYINELQPNKMYGIMKAGTSITLLTKNEVIPKSKVKEKLEELDKRIDFLNTELTKCYIEREKLGTETDIDNNETYIFYMEEEKNFREKQKEILQELLGEE